MKNLIGNTPLLEINFSIENEKRTLFAKCENYNMTGSIKDRMANFIIEKALEKGEMQKGQSIIEATSGNAGISFSAVGASIGSEVHIFMPNWMSQERKDMIKSYGAILHLVSKEEGGFLGSIEKANDYAKRVGGYRPQQFDNQDNVQAHYETTGKEIVEVMQKQGLNIDGFIAGVGTGGTVMGTGKKIKETFKNAIICPLEPSSSPTLSTGCKVGTHRIQGISDEFIPSILDLKSLDDIIAVDDGDAIIMAQKIANQLGLGVGISSGANFLGAIIMQNKYGSSKNIVTIFPDDNKKYLSTDYTKVEAIKKDFLSPKIELLNMKCYRY